MNAERWLAVGVVRYFVEYPSGRRLEVNRDDAHQYGERWQLEGLKLITRLERCAYPVVGVLELTEPGPIPHERFGPSLLRPPVKVKS